jgi:hypothetical protein
VYDLQGGIFPFSVEFMFKTIFPNEKYIKENDNINIPEGNTVKIDRFKHAKLLDMYIAHHNFENPEKGKPRIAYYILLYCSNEKIEEFELNTESKITLPSKAIKTSEKAYKISIISIVFTIVMFIIGLIISSCSV